MELPQYIAACQDVDLSYDVCKFWKNHMDDLTHWSGIAAKVAVLQPSSAAAERAFSILKLSFNNAQDIVETTVMK